MESSDQTTTNPVRIGEHLSLTTSRLGKQTEFQCDMIKNDCCQVFISSPHKHIHNDSILIKCAKLHRCESFDGMEVIVHASYILNMAGMSKVTKDDVLRTYQGNTIRSLINSLDICVLLNNGIIGKGCVVVHPNSNGKNKNTLDNMIKSSKESLESVGDFTVNVASILSLSEEEIIKRRRLALEVCAGEGCKYGKTIEELKDVIDAVPLPGLGICLDTAHLHGMGEYNLGTICGTNKLIMRMTELGMENRLFCLHLNDSKVPLGSKKDRHETLGRGFIYENGLEPLKPLLDWIKDVPVILETPAAGRSIDYEELSALYSS